MLPRQINENKAEKGFGQGVLYSKKAKIVERRKPLQDYVHRPFSEEVMAIGGHYRFTDETRILFGGQALLYLKGYAVFDTTCCGAGGCSYVLVQGFIVHWKDRQDEDGHFVSRILPISDLSLRRNIERWIKKREVVQQVRFV